MRFQHLSHEKSLSLACEVVETESTPFRQTLLRSSVYRRKWDCQLGRAKRTCRSQRYLDLPEVGVKNTVVPTCFARWTVQLCTVSFHLPLHVAVIKAVVRRRKWAPRQVADFSLRRQEHGVPFSDI